MTMWRRAARTGPILSYPLISRGTGHSSRPLFAIQPRQIAQLTVRKMATVAAGAGAVTPTTESSQFKREDLEFESSPLYQYIIDKSMFHHDITILEEEEGLIDKETRENLARRGASYTVLLETSRDYRRLMQTLEQFREDVLKGKYEGVKLEDALLQLGISQEIIDFGKNLSDQEWNDFIEDLEKLFEYNTPFDFQPKSVKLQELQRISLEKPGSRALEHIKTLEKENLGYNTWLIDFLRPFDYLENEGYSKSKLVHDRIEKKWKKYKPINSPRDLFIALVLGLIVAIAHKIWQWNITNKHEQQLADYYASEEEPHPEILEKLYQELDKE